MDNMAHKEASIVMKQQIRSEEVEYDVRVVGSVLFMLALVSNLIFSF